MPLVITALAVFALAYRFYFSFIAAKVAVVNELKTTPAHKHYDGQNFFPMSKWVLFGNHFAAIAGAGPLVGPVLAAQFGYFPGFVWMLVGAVMAGAVHDFIILVASVRHEGKSLAEIAKLEISKLSGITTSIAVMIIILVATAGLGIVVVNALADSSWSLFTIAATIPIAMAMGIWMFKFRQGKTTEATIFGVILLSAAVIFGKFVPGTALGDALTFEKKPLALMLAVYGFFTSVLPVWLLLTPRGYLSSIMKLAVIGLLAVGVIIVAPDMQMPAFTSFIHGGGPIIPGSLFPYLFITIACGAISGFHSLVSSGTSSKMLSSESHIRMVTAGSMLAEGIVSILALIAACSLMPLDYFIINVAPDKLAAIMPQLQSMGFTTSEIGHLTAQVGDNIVGKTGGAVSLAVGMAKIFSSIPGLDKLMSYWFHFAIMFEALFILTTIDAGTRIARLLMQESLGRVYKPFAKTNWLPGNIICSVTVVFAWGWFIYSGNVSTIWPMFGTANQLLATLALAVGTSYIINRGRAGYAWVTLLPMIFVGATTVWAGIANSINIYYPMLFVDATFAPGLINLSLTSVIIICLFIIVAEAVPRWLKVIRGQQAIIQEAA